MPPDTSRRSRQSHSQWGTAAGIVVHDVRIKTKTSQIASSITWLKVKHWMDDDERKKKKKEAQMGSSGWMLNNQRESVVVVGLQ